MALIKMVHAETGREVFVDERNQSRLSKLRESGHEAEGSVERTLSSRIEPIRLASDRYSYYEYEYPERAGFAGYFIDNLTGDFVGVRTLLRLQRNGVGETPSRDLLLEEVEESLRPLPRADYVSHEVEDEE